MKRPLLLFFALIAVVIVFCSWPGFGAPGQQSTPPDAAGAASDQRVVLTIGDEKITAAQIGDFVRALPAQYQAYYGGPGKRFLPQYIIAMKVLSAEALKLNLAKQPDVAQALEIARESVLSDAARKHFYQVSSSVIKNYAASTRRTKPFRKKFACGTFSSRPKTPR